MKRRRRKGKKLGEGRAGENKTSRVMKEGREKKKDIGRENREWEEGRERNLEEDERER